MISYLPECRGWLLGNDDYSYAFAVNPEGVHLKHLYWGAPIDTTDVANLAAEQRDWWANASDTQDMRQPGALWFGFESAPRAFTEEVVASGAFRFDETSVAVRLADGSTGLALSYLDHEIVHDGHEERLTVSLRDASAGVRVNLHYGVDHRSSVLARWVTILNEGTHPVEVERAASGAWALPSLRSMRVRNFFGHVKGEFQLEDGEVPHGTRTLGSRTGTSGHRGTPWIAIHEGASETAGEVWSVALAYTGSWRITTQRSDDSGLHVVAGVADEEVRCRLLPGGELGTPRVLGAYSANGFGDLSALWHHHVNAVVVPAPRRPLPVLYNSYFALQFGIDHESMVEQAKIAADLGVEVFVIDDGWQAGRVDDFNGLGHWVPDRAKFPDGMGGLRHSLENMGVELGLWVEPEMCTPDSPVFQQHPDWIHTTRGRPGQTHRNQHVLDFGRAEVQTWAVEQVSAAVQEAGCTYVVWDMNRPLPLGGVVPDSGARQRHADGLMAVVAELRGRHPGVIWQACSGGGGRADLGILSGMGMTWISDNTDAHNRAAMVSAASHVLPVNTVVHWVTDLTSRNPLSDLLQHTSSLQTRFAAAMNGVLGISADLRHWTPQERQEAAELVNRYKEIRHLVAEGKSYRLPISRKGSALGYVGAGATEAAVVVIAPPPDFGENQVRIRLRGLDPDVVYDIPGHAPTSGRLLMQHGLLLDGSQDTSWVLRLQRRN
jgi:alpha-galactosidase